MYYSIELRKDILGAAVPKALSSELYGTVVWWYREARPFFRQILAHEKTVKSALAFRRSHLLECRIIRNDGARSSSQDTVRQTRDMTPGSSYALGACGRSRQP